MATIEQWQKYMNLLHEFALVEDDLREAVDYAQPAGEFAQIVLYERFAVDNPALHGVESV